MKLKEKKKKKKLPSDNPLIYILKAIEVGKKTKVEDGEWNFLLSRFDSFL